MVPQRQIQLEQLKSRKFDLLVIGGGITGAGIALDAASRGLKVTLVEKGDFASGTSSKSTKLIHGGLRYLKQFEFKVVYEVGRERAIVHRLAPHLVKPEKMLLPIYQGGSFGKIGTAFGLWLYDFLAGVKGEDKRRMLNQQQSLEGEPLLRKEHLLGAGIYAEYRTDDARLTIEVVKTAIRHGATCLNYVEVTDFREESGQLTGATCLDHATGELALVSATTIVNAAGPWVDKLRGQAKSLNNKRLFLSKGAHIVVPRERLPLHHATYFDVADGRMVFAIPRQRSTYIGTTDTPFNGNLDEAFADISDMNYLLDAANAMFPSAKLSLSDVESTWAGLRPLIYKEGKSVGQMSRKDEIFVSEVGLISVAGGKLTGYRKMAKKLVDLVLKKQGRMPQKCQTKSIPLTLQPFANISEVLDFQLNIEKKIKNLTEANTTAIYLTENYGRDAEKIVEAAFAKDEITDASLITSELQHSLDSELVMNPIDFFERRTGLLYFNIQRARQHMEVVLADFQAHFGWSNERLGKERTDLVQLMKKLNPMSA
ncbi:MAG: glycerol-3-phosphate dehydrogenase/oxidase [Saprospiraceae bacterium]|nr:glycerol-3-phosphate dehydrogenase/oxidase [Saprospiraceae bacterium]